jgi:hypothetical protein
VLESHYIVQHDSNCYNHTPLKKACVNNRFNHYETGARFSRKQKMTVVVVDVQNVFYFHGFQFFLKQSKIGDT